jgi:hypothetical protein
VGTKKRYSQLTTQAHIFLCKIDFFFFCTIKNKVHRQKKNQNIGEKKNKAAPPFPETPQRTQFTFISISTTTLYNSGRDIITRTKSVNEKSPEKKTEQIKPVFRKQTLSFLDQKTRKTKYPKKGNHKETQTQHYTKGNKEEIESGRIMEHRWI